MIVDDRIRDYIHSLESGQGELCDEIAKEAIMNYVPIIKQETAALLKTLVVAQQPGAILEVGTAVGYSALLMAQVMPADCHITTIEKYEPRIPIAKENFRRSGKQNRITLLEGDAEEILAGLTENYDFVFMDAAKGQYIHWLPMVLKVLTPGGMLVSDNVFQDGDIVQSRYAVERRNRTIHSRMREYLYVLKHSEELETALVPIGDGVAISVKRRDDGRDYDEKD
ncbi:MAG: O-methyltransferase [Hungatella sp.]